MESENPILLDNPRLYHRVTKAEHWTLLSQLKPATAITPYFSEIHTITIL
jgi:hypothetical protein